MSVSSKVNSSSRQSNTRTRRKVCFENLLLAACLPLFLAPLGSTVDSARRQSYCHVANDTCYRRSECGSKLEMVYSVCGNSTYCQLDLSDELEICVNHLRNLRHLEPVLDCFCPVIIEPPASYERCLLVWRFLFRHACESPRLPPTPASRDAAGGGARLRESHPTQVPPKASNSSSSSSSSPGSSAAAYLAKIRQLQSDPLPDDGRGASCLERRSRCFDEPACTADADAFVNRCGFDDVSECPSRRAPCLQSYEALRRHGLIPCTCLNYSGAERLQCDRIRRVYPGNLCLRFFNDAYNIGLLHQKSTEQQQQQQIGGSSGAEEDRKPDSEAVVKPNGGGGVIHPSSFELIKPTNCFDIYQSCVRHYDCLQRFIALAQACEWLPVGAGRCRDRRLCLAQLEAFYAYADRFANEAATCGCPPADADCVQLSAIFRPRCAYEPPGQLGAAVNCVQLVESCRTNRSCFAKLIHYSRACDARTSDGESASCTPDQPARCQRMRRLLLGSELTQRCSCEGDRGRQTRLRRLCLELRTLLTEPLCLRSELHHPVSGVSAVDACGLARRHGFPAAPSPYLRLPLLNSTASTDGHYARGYSRLCRCVEGGTVCLPAAAELANNERSPTAKAPEPSLSNWPPGLYLGLAVATRQQSSSGGYNWAQAMSQLLGRTTTPDAASDCPLITESSSLGRDGEAVLLKLQLPPLPAADGSAEADLRQRQLHFCLRQLRLLALLVAKQLPEVRLEPQLSRLRSALITYLPPPPPPPRPPSVLDGGDFDSTRLGQRGGGNGAPSGRRVGWFCSVAAIAAVATVQLLVAMATVA